MAKREASLSDVVLAAGGIVWRQSRRRREIALVHRPKFDDWTLPKGKLDPGERWQDAAVREVEEETGFEVQLVGFAGGYTYLSGRAPKVVLYWHMEVDPDARFAPEDMGEVDALEWLTVRKARRRLTYPRDRQVLMESARSGIHSRGAAKRRRWVGGIARSAWVRRVARLRSSWRSSSSKRTRRTRRWQRHRSHG
jgi:8-oxo-dGTP diphosphatase